MTPACQHAAGPHAGRSQPYPPAPQPLVRLDQTTEMTPFALFTARLVRVPALALTAFWLLAGAPAWAQKKPEALPANAPQGNPYLYGKQAQEFGTPEQLMAAAGILSLGGFEFGTGDTASVDALLAGTDILWIETAHFELGFALGEYKVALKDKRKLVPELERLEAKLPTVDSGAKRLDRWLRALLFAQRLEELYTRVQRVLQVTDANFPPEDTVWNMEGEYWGRGPFLGQVGKYEVLILPGEAPSEKFLRESFGLVVKRTQRWNVLDRDSLILVVNDADEGLLKDAAMHCHVVYNMTINLLDGYRHYSFELPFWLRAGLAHVLEREVWPEFNTFDISEGGEEIETYESDWLKEAREHVAAGEQSSLARLSSKENYSDLTFGDHLTSWSMMQYLVHVHPDALAKILGRLAGLVNEQGYPDGSDMPEHQREAFREFLGMPYPLFDESWKTWLATPHADLVNEWSDQGLLAPAPQMPTGKQKH